MGTRADFYTSDSDTKIWIGSIGWDGYVEGIDDDVLNAKSEAQFATALTNFFEGRRDVTLPSVGWPWPWETSHTTDCAYVFNGEFVELYSWGRGPMTMAQLEDEDYEPPRADFPDMSDVQNVAMGEASGLIVFSA